MYGVLTKETEDVQLGTLCFVLYVVMEDVPQGLDDADGEADVVGDDLGLTAQLASESQFTSNGGLQALRQCDGGHIHILIGDC